MDTNMQKYIAFLKTVEYGSFSRAAEALGYSQSSISHMISSLEQEWNVLLLSRSRAGVQLTSDGLKLLPLIKDLYENFRRVQDQVDELNCLDSGLIRIGTFSSIATHWLPNVIKAFHHDYPHINYELLLGDYSQVEHWIAEGRIDCGFLRLPTLPDYETISLGLDEMLVILPTDHPLAKCESFPVKALEGAPFMMVERGGDAEIASIFKENQVHPNIQVSTWDDYAIMAMVEAGLGISILPKLILHRQSYRIVRKELEKPVYREIGLALKSVKGAPLAVKKFIDYIQISERSPLLN